MLTLLGMERSKTARECIKIMGALAEKYGYGFNDDGEMLAVSDPNEVWVFEIMPVGPLWTPETGKPGAVWCAQRLPDDHVSVCPNESRIGEIDLNNRTFSWPRRTSSPAPSRTSSTTRRAASRSAGSGPIRPAEGSAVEHPGPPRPALAVLRPRRALAEAPPETPNMDLPFSVKPDKKLSVQDVMDMTRDKCYGTKFDPVKGIRGGPFANPNY